MCRCRLRFLSWRDNRVSFKLVCLCDLLLMMMKFWRGANPDFVHLACDQLIGKPKRKVILTSKNGLTMPIINKIRITMSHNMFHFRVSSSTQSGYLTKNDPCLQFFRIRVGTAIQILRRLTLEDEHTVDGPVLSRGCCFSVSYSEQCSSNAAQFCRSSLHFHPRNPLDVAIGQPSSLCDWLILWFQTTG